MFKAIGAVNNRNIFSALDILAGVGKENKIRSCPERGLPAGQVAEYLLNSHRPLPFD
jgi:hypothetical protein